MRKCLRCLLVVSLSVNVIFLVVLMCFLLNYYIVLPKNAEEYIAVVRKIMGRTLTKDAVTPVSSWGGVEFFELDTNQDLCLVKLKNEPMSVIAYISNDIVGVVVGESGFELSNGQGTNIMNVSLTDGNNTQYKYTYEH